jgi:hypothetical protein
VSDLWKIVLTSALTVVGGVLVFVFGQLVQRFIIEPQNEQVKLIGEIAYTLAYYAPIYGYPSPGRVVMGPGGINLTEATEDKLRALASHLIASVTTTRWPELADRVFSPPHKDVLASARALIGLSNSVRSGNTKDNLEIRDNILKLLRIDWPY